jgi:hypothetical protein
MVRLRDLDCCQQTFRLSDSVPLHLVWGGLITWKIFRVGKPGRRKVHSRERGVQICWRWRWRDLCGAPSSPEQARGCPYA